MAEEQVRRVDGEYRNWGTSEEPRFHVSWICPACGRWHDTDVEPGETSPMLFECEHPLYDEQFLVVWSASTEPDGSTDQ